jgi:hypothetical protein
MIKKVKEFLNKVLHLMVGYRSRPTYWTCSAFSDWIRKVSGVDAKPHSATSEGWCEWHMANHKKFGYWLSEEGLDILQDIWMFVPDVYRNVRQYVRNRYIDKTHYLDTKLKKGEWHEFDSRLIHGMFEALVDFVEDEKASMMRWTSDEKFNLPNAEKGIEYLKWEIALKDNAENEPGSEGLIRQSKHAEETLALYKWWKEIRPTRKEPGEAVGLWDLYENSDDEKDDNVSMRIWGCRKRDPEIEEKRHELYKKSNEVETQYYVEDTEMMIRLVKLRDSLWT